MSILTDYKHGFDAKPNQLRLTLLKAPIWPDPGCDRGLQIFSYAIYPHAHSWQQTKTVQAARNFNLPVRAVLPQISLPERSPWSPGSPNAISWLDLGDNSFVLTALKQAEDSGHHYILRGYESAGVYGDLLVGGNLPVDMIVPVDLLEQAQSAEWEALGAWQVKSLEIAYCQAKL